MAKINLLDAHTAELIAAGEVVERPASAVKELLENAFDAGATRVVLEIKGGGIAYIRITDNGCGIDREDIRTAFMRHATSKIRTEADLDGILTLGFRGEALASICAVARVEMFSCAEGAELGSRIVIEGGQERLLEEAGCPQGTTLIVRDLFYNTPARMKFLKKDVAEGNAVAAVAERLALSHPEVSLRFIRDGKTIFHTPGDGLLASAINAVLGREFLTNLIEVDYSYGGLEVKGFASAPIGAKATRNSQFFFINGRFVKSRTCMAALEESYRGFLVAGKYPVCVLFLSLPADRIDVNVHPAKTEVRFTNEKPVFDIVYYGVKNALMQQDKRPSFTPTKSPFTPPAAEQIPLPTRPKTGMEGQPVSVPKAEPIPPTRVVEPKPVTPPVGERTIPSVTYTAPGGSHYPVRSGVSYARDGGAAVVGFQKSEQPEKIEKTPQVEVAEIRVEPKLPPVVEIPRKEEHPVVPTEQEKKVAAEPPAETFAVRPKPRVCGEIYHCYVIAEYDGEAYLIDKHAAHERIIYNKLLAERREPDKQLLLIPMTVSLRPKEFQAIVENLSLLDSLGFEVEEFGDRTILVRTVPMLLSGENCEDMLGELAEKLSEGRAVSADERLERIFHTVACKAAIKAGSESDRKELESLAEEVFAGTDIMRCPHGRPVAFRLTRSFIERQFGRA